MAITRATNLAGLGTVFDALTDGGGLSISGISTFTDLNVTGVTTTITLVATAASITSGGLVAGIATVNNINTTQLNVAGLTTVGFLTVGTNGDIITTTVGFGSVGLGTYNPRGKLDVRGNIVISENINGKNVLAFGIGDIYAPLAGAPNGSGGGVFIVGNTSDDTGAPSYLTFHTSDSGIVYERFRLTSEGYIGIASETPRGTIDITKSPEWGSANYGASIVVGGGRNNSIAILDSTDTLPWAIANAGGNLSFSRMPILGTGGSPSVRLKIDVGGNVLIGDVGSATSTGTASQLLQVNSGAYFSGSVGIGATNPAGLTAGSSNTLHVNAGDAVLRVGPYYTTGGDRDHILLVAHPTNTYIRSNNEQFSVYNNSGDLVVHTGVGDTERIRVYSAGHIDLRFKANPVLQSNFLAINALSSLNLTSDIDTSNGFGGHCQIAFRAPYAVGNADRVSYAAISGRKEDAGQGGRRGFLAFYTNNALGGSPTELTEAARFNGDQELLIGYTSDNGGYKLQVNSQIFATSATIATSDGRYKENVSSLENCTELIKQLRPVSFTWKPQENIVGYHTTGEPAVREAHNFPKGYQVGFIAQEVKEVLSNKPWVSSIIKENVRQPIVDADEEVIAPEEIFYGIAEGNMVAVLTAALKESISEIETLKAKVSYLETQVGIAST